MKEYIASKPHIHHAFDIIESKVTSGEFLYKITVSTNIDIAAKLKANWFPGDTDVSYDENYRTAKFSHKYGGDGRIRFVIHDFLYNNNSKLVNTDVYTTNERETKVDTISSQMATRQKHYSRIRTTCGIP